MAGGIPPGEAGRNITGSETGQLGAVYRAQSAHAYKSISWYTSDPPLTFQFFSGWQIENP